MIEYVAGDITEANSEALVNTINCVGTMGRGLALRFRRIYPDNYQAYIDACERNEVRPGRMLVFCTGQPGNPRFIINFPTKRHWKSKSRIEDIDLGLVSLVDEVERRGIRSIAIPALGCDLGGLDWRDVRPRIESAFRPLAGVRVVLFEPQTST